MKRAICYSLLVSITLILAACQKEADPELITNRPPDIVFDSTQLVKSITLVYKYQTPQETFITEKYSYDTVNHTISVNWESDDPYDNDMVNATAVHSYNSHNLLTSITYHYTNGFTPYNGDYTSVEIEYDNQDVLKKVVLNYYGLPSITKNYTKTQAGTGYQLDWTTPFNDPRSPDYAGNKQTSVFAADGKCLKYRYNSLLRDVNGNITDQIDFLDSSIYSSSGELEKVYRTIPNSTHPEQTVPFVLYEFESRYEKGDQLSRQRKLLFSGLHQLEFDESDNWLWTSILTDTPDAYEYDQYTGHPFRTAKVYNRGTSTKVPFTSEVSFDSLDRLVSFKGYFDDGDLIPQVYRMTYYK